jgi:hypothetical protein
MQGFVDDFVVFVTPVLVIVAAVRRDVLLCTCTQGLVDVAVARRDVSTACALVHIAFAI